VGVEVQIRILQEGVVEVEVEHHLLVAVVEELGELVVRLLDDFPWVVVEVLS
jgi:hypothetical protein